MSLGLCRPQLAIFKGADYTLARLARALMPVLRFSHKLLGRFHHFHRRVNLRSADAYEDLPRLQKLGAPAEIDAVKI